MSISRTAARPTWITDDDERPHAPGNDPLWSENYLTYVHSPGSGVSVYVHLCRLPGPVERWDEIVFILLPDDEVIVSKAISKRRECNGVAVNGIEFLVDEPYQRLTKSFVGAGRRVTGAELRKGPLTDGPEVAVDLVMTATAMSPTYDFGTEHLDQEWAHGHYEQHMTFEGSLSIDGGEPIQIAGTGLRDHSWGPRDYAKIGTTTWLHGQFPESGRSFMAVRVTGVPPKPEFDYAVICDAETVTAVSTTDLPMASSYADTQTDYAFQFTNADGAVTSVTAEIIGATRCSFHGPAALMIGTLEGPDINHDYIDAFTRFTWDGEVGYGVTERTVDHNA